MLNKFSYAKKKKTLYTYILYIKITSCVLNQAYHDFECFSLNMTYQRTETRPRQCHREGCHGNWAKIQDFRIDVEWRESLNQTKKSIKKRLKSAKKYVED